jgi:hypothetical protein
MAVLGVEIAHVKNAGRESTLASLRFLITLSHYN